MQLAHDVKLEGADDATAVLRLAGGSHNAGCF